MEEVQANRLAESLSKKDTAKAKETPKRTTQDAHAMASAALMSLQKSLQAETGKGDADAAHLAARLHPDYKHKEIIKKHKTKEALKEVIPAFSCDACRA